MAKRGTRTTHTSTVDGLVSDALSQLEELGNEIREVVDNAPENLSQSERITTLSDTADVLENLSAPDVPGELAEVEASYTSGPSSRKQSRASRRDEAVTWLQAAADVLEGIVQDTTEEGDDADDRRSMAEELAGDILNIISEAENCEFPGMFG